MVLVPAATSPLSNTPCGMTYSPPAFREMSEHGRRWTANVVFDVFEDCGLFSQSFPKLLSTTSRSARSLANASHSSLRAPNVAKPEATSVRCRGGGPLGKHINLRLTRSSAFQARQIVTHR